MCGISTIYKYSLLTQEDVEKVKGMNLQMHYRGPDGEGYWHDSHCAMSHTRLSIIGLKNGAQPLYNTNKSLVLICNGEIYNYVELKQQLIAKGYSFETDSDVEPILYLYELYGDDCVQHLRGVFSFCLYDVSRQRLIIARDRLGEKPLYFAEIPCGVVVSSELKAILKYYVPNPQLNVQSLLEPIRFTGGVDQRNTFISQIKRVLPGELLIVDKEGLQYKRYWQRKRTYDFEGSVDEAKKETLQLMQESVDLQMRSEVPIALMLSGGIDSSAVAALAKRSGHEVCTITTGYTGSHVEDERVIAHRFAKEQGFNHYEIELSEKDYLDAFEELVSYLDEPITDSTAIPEWAMFKKVQRLGFKVILGGMGGDELFYGYPAWNALGESLRLRREHESLFPWKGWEKKRQWLHFMRKNWQWVLYGGYPSKLEDKSFGWWIHDDFYRFLDNAKLNIGGSTIDLEDFRYRIQKGFPICQQGKEVDVIYDDAIDTVMTQAYLYLSDRLSMGNSIENRSPLLDYKLVEHVFSLPLEYKFNPNNPKQYLKDVLKGIVPDYILYAPKRGFTSPNSFVDEVVKSYNYQFFSSDYKFYNSVLVDKLLSQLWK